MKRETRRTVSGMSVLMGGLLAAALPGLLPRSEAKPRSRVHKPTRKAAPRAVNIAWRKSFAIAMAESKRTGKPIMADFFATWCGPCQMLEQTTWKSPQVAKAAQGFIPVKVDVDKNQPLASKYQISSIPAVMFMTPNGKVVHSFVGYVEPGEATRIINTAYAKAKAGSKPHVISARLPVTSPAVH